MKFYDIKVALTYLWDQVFSIEAETEEDARHKVEAEIHDICQEITEDVVGWSAHEIHPIKFKIIAVDDCGSDEDVYDDSDFDDDDFDFDDDGLDEIY